MSSASTSLWYKERRTVQRTWTALPIHGWSRRRNARALGAWCIVVPARAGHREMASRGAVVNGNLPHASHAPGRGSPGLVWGRRPAPVETPVLDGLGQVRGGDLVVAGEVRDRARHAQDA